MRNLRALFLTLFLFAALPSAASALHLYHSRTILPLGQRLAQYKTVKYGASFYPAPMIAPRPEGGSFLGWNDRHWTPHITPLDQHDQRRGPDIVLPNRLMLLALVAQQGGFAVLAAEPIRTENPLRFTGIRLLRYDDTGKMLFDQQLVKAGDLSDEGAQVLYASGNFHLAWSGSYYAAYFSIKRNFGTREKPDVHQGDTLVIVDALGKVQRGGWKWGVSHSFEQRLLFDTGRFFALAKGDAYPRGMAFSILGVDGVLNSKRHNLLKMPGRSGENYVPFTLGGMVLLDDGLLISFSSVNDRSSYDVGLMKIDLSGNQLWLKWLTDTPEVHESSVQMAALGKDRVVVAWNAHSFTPEKPSLKEQDHFRMVVLDISGTVLQELSPPDAAWHFNGVWKEPRRLSSGERLFSSAEGNNFKMASDGSVVWAAVAAQDHLVEIHRLSLQKRVVTPLKPEQSLPPDEPPPLDGPAACESAKDIYGSRYHAGFPVKHHCLVVLTASGRTDYKIALSNGLTSISLAGLDTMYPPIGYPEKTCSIVRLDLMDVDGDGISELLLQGVCGSSPSSLVNNNRVYRVLREKGKIVEDKRLSRQVEKLASWEQMVRLLTDRVADRP